MRPELCRAIFLISDLINPPTLGKRFPEVALLMKKSSALTLLKYTMYSVNLQGGISLLLCSIFHGYAELSEA